MLELIAELGAAGNLLESALLRYFSACTAIQTYYSRCNALAGVPQILSNCIANEVATVSSYEFKLKQSISIISQARNCSASLAHIHRLPSEILARIFILVASDSCRVDVGGSRSRAMPRYPDFLSHVCSRWRRTTLALPELWEHVDLVYYHSSSQKFIDRAETFVTRANHLPLHLHVRAPTPLDRWSGIGATLGYIYSLGKRVGSFELVIPETVEDFHNAFYDLLFEEFEPGTLHHLTIKDYSLYAPNFIRGSDDFNGSDFEDEDEDEEMDDMDETDGLRLRATQESFESLLAQIKYLRLDGTYPRWTSQAYSGLVELRLDQPPGRGSAPGITASELHSILVSSPKLVVLHFGLQMIDNPAIGHDIAPVHMEDLEILNFSSHSKQPQLEIFLSLLAPGPKPLQLTMRLYGIMEALSDHDAPIAKFLKRSNITRLYIGSGGYDFEADKLLVLLPHLRVLALQGFSKSRVIPTFRKPSGDIHSLVPLQLDTVYLQGGHYDIEYLDQLIKKYSIQSMVVWRTTVLRGIGFVELEPDVAKAELSEMCPTFRYIDALAANPIEWGFLF